MSKITIHRALSELKLIDKRIEKQIAEINPLGIYQKDKLVDGAIKREVFDSNAKAAFQSINDLLGRKKNIKSAIVNANAITSVQVAGKTMTIADAITFKSLIVLKKKFIEQLKARQRTTMALYNRNNEMIQQNVKNLLEAALGKDVKTDSNDVDAVSKPYITANEVHLADPLDINATIQNLEKEVSDFEADVDAVLSEINATTFVEITE